MAATTEREVVITPSAGVSLVISDEVVMSRRARRTFLLLSGVVIGAMLTFGSLWVHGRDWDHPLLYLLATLVLGYHLAVWLAAWVTIERMRRPRFLVPEAGLRVATATTFVPGAEPLDMLEQTLAAIVAMEYPHDTFVLDESDDPAVRALCERLGASHYTRRHRAEYREPRGSFAAGTKYGNYNSWLDEIANQRYDVIGTFDPDHVPERDYLTRTLGYFKDPAVGYVQAPQVYYNQGASFIARGAAEESYRYYSSLQMSNYAFGEPVVTGCHTLHRISALQAVGGFPAHDAEDLYITLLYGASEWRGVYVPEILALGITPVGWRGYLGQQTRWARALLDLKIRIYPALAARLTPTKRLLGFFHGAYYLRSLSYPVLYLMVMYMLVAGVDVRFASGRMLFALALLTLVLRVADRFSQHYFLDRRREGGLHWRAILLQVAKWPWFVRAAWEAVRGTKPAYLLTPKVAEPVRGSVVARPHLAIAALLAGAWVLGTALHGPAPLLLQLITAMLVALSLGIAGTEWREYPPPFELHRHAKRRAVLGELLARTDVLDR